VGFLLDAALGAVDYGTRGALAPFVAAGDIPQATADNMGNAVVDGIRMLESASSHPITENPLRDAVRGYLQPFVASNATTAQKADEMTDAIMGGVHLFQTVTTPKKTA
jgi:hypothetical protein